MESDKQKTYSVYTNHTLNGNKMEKIYIHTHFLDKQTAFFFFLFFFLGESATLRFYGARHDREFLSPPYSKNENYLLTFNIYFIPIRKTTSGKLVFSHDL